MSPIRPGSVVRQGVSEGLDTPSVKNRQNGVWFLSPIRSLNAPFFSVQGNPTLLSF